MLPLLLQRRTAIGISDPSNLNQKNNLWKTKGAYDYANNYVELENGNMSMLGLHAMVKRSTGNRFMKLLGNRIFHLLSVILMLMISYIRWIMNYINWRQIMIV